MQDLYFDSSTHSYYYKGEKKPCVSDVLKMVDVIALEGIPQRNLETAAEQESTSKRNFSKLDLLTGTMKIGAMKTTIFWATLTHMRTF